MSDILRCLHAYLDIHLSFCMNTSIQQFCKERKSHHVQLDVPFRDYKFYDCLALLYNRAYVLSRRYCLVVLTG